MLRRWGKLYDDVVLSTEMVMEIGHCKDFLKLTFRALALCHSL